MDVSCHNIMYGWVKVCVQLDWAIWVSESAWMGDRNLSVDGRMPPPSLWGVNSTVKCCGGYILQENGPDPLGPFLYYPIKYSIHDNFGYHYIKSDGQSLKSAVQQDL